MLIVFLWRYISIKSQSDGLLVAEKILSSVFVETARS